MADILGVFEQAVLVAVVHLRGVGYGRSILKQVEARLDRDVTASAVYATLDRLEDKGLVRSRYGDPTPQRGGRARRYFKVTSSGVRAVSRAQRSFQRLTQGLVLPGGVRA